MFCPNCGSKIADDARFCNICGSKIETAAPVETAAETVSAPAMTGSAAAGTESVPMPQTLMPEPVPAAPNVPEYAQSPVYVNPAQVSYTVPAPQAAVKNKPSAGRCAGAVILCILGGLLLCAFIVLASLRVAISKTSIKFLMQDISEEIGYDDFISDLSSEFRHSGIEGIDDIDGVDELAAQLIHDFLGYTLSGEGDPIDTDAVVDWVEDNKKAFEKATGHEITKQDIRDLRDELDEINDEINDDYDDIDIEFKIIQKVFGIAVLLTILGGVLVCFLLVFAVFGKFYDKSFVYVGVTTLVISAILAIASGFLTALFKMHGGNVSIDDVGFVGRFLFSRSAFTSLAFTLLGIIEIVLGKVLGKNNKAYFA